METDWREYLEGPEEEVRLNALWMRPRRFVIQPAFALDRAGPDGGAGGGGSAGIGLGNGAIAGERGHRRVSTDLPPTRSNQWS